MADDVRGRSRAEPARRRAARSRTRHGSWCRPRRRRRSSLILLAWSVLSRTRSARLRRRSGISARKPIRRPSRWVIAASSPTRLSAAPIRLSSEVDQLVRQAQIGLPARGTMTGADFRGHLVDERPSSLTVHHPGDFAELLQTSQDRLACCCRSALALSTYALTVSGVIRVPGASVSVSGADRVR